MKIGSPRQLKDWINNVAKENNLIANTVLQNFMMERLLERISISKYKDNFILKGGFLIAAMVGIDMRSTMDMDTTIKGIPVNREAIEEILKLVKKDMTDSKARITEQWDNDLAKQKLRDADDISGDLWK